MFKYEYEIGQNEEGRPIIIPSKNNENHPEHKFMGVEYARHSLNQLLVDNEKENELPEQIVEEIARAGVTLEYVADQIAMMLIELDKNMDDLGLDVKDDD